MLPPAKSDRVLEGKMVLGPACPSPIHIQQVWGRDQPESKLLLTKVRGREDRIEAEPQLETIGAILVTQMMFILFLNELLHKIKAHDGPTTGDDGSYPQLATPILCQDHSPNLPYCRELGNWACIVFLFFCYLIKGFLLPTSAPEEPLRLMDT